MHPRPHRPRRSERGASATEYGLLITGIAALIVAMVFLFGGNVGNLFKNTCDSLQNQVNSTNCT